MKLSDFARRAACAAILAVAAIRPVQAESAAAFALRKERAPADVSAYLDRRLECNYWDDEPLDDAHAAWITDAEARLGCRGLHAEEAKLLRRYADRPDIRNLIVDARSRSL